MKGRSARATSGGESDPRQNRILARVSGAEYTPLLERLRPFHADARDEVCRANERIEEVVFPIDAVFSLTTTVDDQTPIEVTTVGNEGFVGLPLFLGAAVSPNDAFCQIPGNALAMSLPDFQESLGRDGELHQLLSRYAQATIVQLSQNVACNRLHPATLRAARWLLMSHDRVHRDTFTLTQEFLARMLGVRRATVSETASELQDKGLIRYSRGNITIVDRTALEGAACECYRRIKDGTENLLNR